MEHTLHTSLLGKHCVQVPQGEIAPSMKMRMATL